MSRFISLSNFIIDKRVMEDLLRWKCGMLDTLSIVVCKFSMLIKILDLGNMIIGNVSGVN